MLFEDPSLHGLPVALCRRLKRRGRAPSLVQVLSLKKHLLDTAQQPISYELRAIKRYLATRSDRLPWLFVSERGHEMTRQAVNYIIKTAGERAWSRTCAPSHVAPLLRLPSRQQGGGFPHDAGLCWPPRSETYNPILPCGRTPVWGLWD